MMLKQLKRPLIWLACAFVVGLVLRHGAPDIGAAFGLNTGGGEEEAIEIEEQTDAVYWNEMAEQYLHTGPISQVFKCYERALALNPKESSIQLNYGNALFLFRQDAIEYYHLTEQQVFDRAFVHYDEALKLDPKNFDLATEIAVSYYGVQPPRHEAALRSWEKALSAADSDFEREGVHIHLARININAGRYQEGAAHLEKVQDEHYSATKEMLLSRIEKHRTGTGKAPVL